MKNYLYFSAPWCGPCRTLGPVMERVNNTIPVQKINVDEQSNVAQQHNVRNIPTVILMENGVEVKRFLGVKSESDYLNI
jgi:thioredoxin-like negative regulator of GroEL